MQFNDDTNKNLTDEKDVKNTYDQEHVEAAAAGTRDEVVIAKDYGQYIHDAQQAVEGQKGESVRVALWRWRRGVIYSIIFST
jgi:hypothetical protein